MGEEVRTLEVTPISAEDLKDVRLFGRMQTYVVAWVDPRQKVSSRLDKHGGTCPRWGDNLSLTVPVRLIAAGGAMLALEVYSRGGALSSSPTLVGRVNVPLSDIPTKSSGSVPFAYRVRRPSGRLQGVLFLSFKLGDKLERAPPAQPPPQPAASADKRHGYPPAQQDYPMAYPPPQQGYPPAQQGYPPAQQGYPPAQHQPYYQAAPTYVTQPAQASRPPQRWGGGGMGGLGGMGLGLGAGLLGGLLVGEIIDDIADNNDYGDYGGGDYGGGDFGGDFGGGGW